MVIIVDSEPTVDEMPVDKDPIAAMRVLCIAPLESICTVPML